MDNLPLRDAFVEGMSRASTFVSVVTTAGETGLLGVTVSAMTSVSADGPMPSLLVCVNQQSTTAAALLQNRRLCANLLHEGQQPIADLFSGRLHGPDGPIPRMERFNHCDWQAGPLEQPMILGAAASFECHLQSAVLWETHYIFIGGVAHMLLSEQPNALLYGQRRYRRAVEMPD